MPINLPTLTDKTGRSERPTVPTFLPALTGRASSL
ncbi:hypothetical protein BJ992_003118 [Sphaerisporangium rubeum]|uniref:Uncharacterized protein n=1 Tax=Sphaerisporangium rubeum TaxID=321317 RepID=A0A7X0M6W7_9ACTN|nr:hypothetical protein [Sphaerisporangium rubeum]